MAPIQRLILAAALLVPFVPARAEAPADATGHWEGAVRAPTEDVLVAVDIAFDTDGRLMGTFSNPSQYLKGFPLFSVAVDGRSVTLELKTSDPGVQTFSGDLSEDGKAMTGEFLVNVYSVPFTLTRTGDAKIAPAPHSPAIDGRLVGEWSGSLRIADKQLPMVLTMTNNADNTATGSWRAGGAVPTPVTIANDGRTVTLASTVTPTTYEGTVNAEGSEISGTMTQGSLMQSLTFTRTSPPDDPLARWATAVGGRDKVAAVNSIYREAAIFVNGFEGTIRAWHTSDGKYRKEERAADFVRIETYDGAHAFVQQGAAPVQELTGARLERAISQAFANTNAVFFAFFPDRRRGDIVVEDDGTLVMQPEGGIDWRVVLDPETSLPRTMTHAEGDRTVTVDFVSYETVEGLRVESEIHRSPGDPRFNAVIRYTKTVLNPPIEAALFTIETPADGEGATADRAR